MRIIQPRLLSNKENATISPDLAAATSTDTPLSYLAKPRVSGIGRAPPKRNHPHQSHSPYPRARTTSVQRAKLRSAKIHKIKHNLKPNPVSEKPSDDMLSLATQKRRHRQPDRTVRIPLQLPKPAIPPVGVLDGKLDGVVSDL